MTSPTPVVDVLLWGRFLLGAALVLWLPGHVWLTRHWSHSAWPVRIAGAVAGGLLLTAGAGRVCSAVGVPVDPWILTPVLVASGLLMGQWPRLTTPLRELDPRGHGAWTHFALGAGLVALVAFVVGFASFPAPPHVDDASNHSFLTERIVETRSVRPEVLFDGPYGRPGLPYLVGLHTGAALVARTGGLAPYVSVWLLVALASTLLPLSLGLLWRQWQAPAPALAAAVVLAVAGRFAPAGVLTWGGFGVVVGMFLTPLVTLFLVGCLRSPSIPMAAMAGLALGTLAHVHASEVAAALLLAAVTWWLDPARPRGRWTGLVVLAVATLLAVGPSTLASASREYVAGGMAAVEHVQTRPWALVERYLKSGGTQPHLVVLWIVSLGLAFRHPRWRRIAAASLGVGMVAFALGAIGDPVSRALSTPFYREPWRLQYLQLFLAPVLMGCAAASALTILRRRTTSSLLPVALAAAFVLPPQADVVRIYRGTWKVIPFSVADYYHALRLRTVVGPDAWIVNDPHDGSTWAAQVSGCRFLRPTSWDLRDASGVWVSQRISAIGEDPWPASFRALRERGALYVYASDTRTGDSVLSRTFLDEDPRFGPVLEGETSTLYRIRW